MQRRSPWKWLLGAFSSAVVFAPLAAWGQSPDAPEPVIARRGNVLFINEEAAADGARRAYVTLVAADKLSEYWLGIALGELPEVAKQQLGIEGGLVVADVMVDSPAAKAEVKKNDILIKAGDAELNEPGDLIKVVDASKGKELTLLVIRGGKDRKITVVPIKRSEAQAKSEQGAIELPARGAEFSDEIKRLEDVLARLKNKAGDGALGLWFAKPAIVESVGEARKAVDVIKDIKAEFPKDLSVRITKDGEQPTRVRVKRGDQEWEVTEDKLSELPDDVRPHVQKLLGRMLAPGFSAAASRILRVQPSGKVEGEIKIAPLPPLPPRAPTAGAKPTPPVPPQVAKLHAYRVESGGVEAKFDAIMKRLDELSKEVDELQRRSNDRK